MSSEILGLKRLRKGSGKGVRQEHSNWGNPNKKHQRKIKIRQDDYDKNLKDKNGYNRPGSHKN